MAILPDKTKIELKFEDKALKGDMSFADGHSIVIDNVDSINTLLYHLYQDDKYTSLGDLINSGVIKIKSGNIWKYYDIKDGRYFVKLSKDKEDTTTKTVTEKDTTTKTVTKDKPKTKTTTTKTAKRPSGAKMTATTTSSTKTAKRTPAKKEDTTKTSKTTKTVKKSKTTEKDTTKKRINLRTVKWTAISLLCIGAAAVIAYLAGTQVAIAKYRNKEDNDDSDTKTGEDKKIEVSINENGEEFQTTYNLPSDEELIAQYIPEEEVEATYLDEPEEEVEATYIDEPEEFVEATYGDEPEEYYETTYNEPSGDYYVSYTNASGEEVIDQPVEYDYVEVDKAREKKYLALGSAIGDEDMAIQLDSIDNRAVERSPFQFENLVVSDDYDAIYAINSMRDKALNGTISNEQYMSTLIDYVFNNGTYVNGSFIEQYNSLHPYGKYIVIRLSQGQSTACINMIDGNMINTYNIEGSNLYTELTRNDYYVEDSFGQK